MRGSLAALALWLLATPANSAATFPEALDARTLSAWLVQETDIKPEQVVAVSRTSVAAIVGGPEQKDGVQRVIVRSEAIDPTLEEDEPILSSQVEVAVDCAGHRTRQGASTGHDQRNLAGVGRVIADQETEWRAPSPGTQLDNVWRAVCDPAFQRPLLARARPPGKPAAAPPADARPVNPRLRLQIGAYGTLAEARAAQERLKSELAAVLDARPTEISPVKVEGKTYFRVLVSGFHSLAEETALCTRLKALGRGCFLRNAGAPAGRTPARKPAGPRAPAPAVHGPAR